MSLTRKYSVSFAKHKSRFVVTYHNNNFKKLEYKSGGLVRVLFLAIGKAIPMYESEIKEHQKKYQDKITIELIEDKKVKSQYTQFMDRYFIFYQGLSEGISPKTGSIEGAALKRIITYLNNQSTSPKEAFEVWDHILSSWHQLEDFYQKQIQLKHIESNLNTIIIQVKDGKPTDKARNKAKRNANEYRAKI